ncbi:uncharacterized protein MONOS_16314 [Monocercomonoides exilis]|uniref:uncharacterized protein n=1 Tax=Monocercomonoides exilis TaxID=2049356 RepID=UPI00355A9C8A|nr:hypothetical protein MONOS_16314 [Monocercomonoides exilis]|eukprot:MONOS_16314.1-p1 / transcript=MONOS_16314.1 / gene=MONOS_16314 / organism=Monocercomonoides_exilis_PA203 / gene_product=unspecified product / transcript_product=unspecified product / location=Mono_scaffold01640:5099-5770(+) / protein_length=223 / sequence_SO=supercontig / SO=protein_coding / is_pseudo=false
MARERDLHDEENISSLNKLFFNETSAWEWFKKEIIAMNLPMCRVHRCYQRIYHEKNYHYYACPKCKIKKSILSGTSFCRIKIGLGVTLLICLYYWLGIQNKTISLLLSVDKDTVGYWGSVIRCACSQMWNERQQVIGGEGTTVEIDEAIWRKRKYRRGRKKKQVWIFGGVERLEGVGAGKRFMVVVPNRKKETLIPTIHKYIKAGIIIISDQWSAHSSLETLG